MASSEHLELSNIIKNAHQSLRNNTKVLGADDAWQKHCADKNMLKEYSEAMRELATKHWEENCNKTQSAAKSRIHWIYDFCCYYFFKEEIFRQRLREKDIAEKINLCLDIDIAAGCFSNKILKVLDVGSCYNPFKIFKCFDVVPIDIAPASEDVFQCDFLNLKIIECCDSIKPEGKQICALPQGAFDVVIFSLLLEYLPCPEQRRLCCINAYKLLSYEGLLIIITPDSKHVGANAKIMKSWRYNLSLLGFSRIKYDKLPHIHCMAFRKSLNIEIASRWVKLQSTQHFYHKMFIPQDFNDFDNTDINDVKQHKDVNEDIEDRLLLLNELPSF